MPCTSALLSYQVISLIVVSVMYPILCFLKCIIEEVFGGFTFQKNQYNKIYRKNKPFCFNKQNYGKGGQFKLYVYFLALLTAINVSTGSVKRGVISESAMLTEMSQCHHHTHPPP